MWFGLLPAERDFILDVNQFNGTGLRNRQASNLPQEAFLFRDLLAKGVCQETRRVMYTFGTTLQYEGCVKRVWSVSGDSQECWSCVRSVWSVSRVSRVDCFWRVPRAFGFCLESVKGV